MSNFFMDKELYSTVITKAHDTKELAYFNLMNHMQSQHGLSVVFDSFKQLIKLTGMWIIEKYSNSMSCCSSYKCC